MKSRINIVICLGLMIGLLAVQCGSQQGIAGDNHKGMTLPENSILQLSDLLRREPGLTVQGTGDNVSVLIRGISSIEGPTQPLFVINGTPVGDSYASAANAVVVQEIQSINVLAGAKAALYGSRASNGVIEIKTKSRKDE